MIDVRRRLLLAATLAPFLMGAGAPAPQSELEHELQRELNKMPPPATLPLPETLACYQRLAAIARFSPLPIRSTPSQCATIDLVRLDRVLMPDNSEVAVTPAPALRCSMAEAIAGWVRNDVGAAAAALNAQVAAVTDLDSYQCRPRNNIPGGKLSEHGKANALDVGSIKLKNGTEYNLTDPKSPRQFREALRESACARFMTVLGPGSDSYHNSHIHLDLQERSNNYRICQWNVIEPGPAVVDVPLPRSRPEDVGPERKEAAHEEPQSVQAEPRRQEPPRQETLKPEPAKPEATKQRPERRSRHPRRFPRALFQ